MNRQHITAREELIINEIIENKIIAIVRGIQESKLIKTVEALYNGGIKLVEVTFNQSDPNCNQTLSKQITMLKEHFGDNLMIGVGTVMSTEQVDVAAAVRAEYIISPHTNVDVIRHTKEKGLVSIPGAYTATEVFTAHDAGADFIKIFPISTCGHEYIAALRGPLSQVRLLAVGGVDETNICSFLEAGCVGAGVGGKLVDKAASDADNFSEIEAAARSIIAEINK